MRLNFSVLLAFAGLAYVGMRPNHSILFAPPYQSRSVPSFSKHAVVLTAKVSQEKLDKLSNLDGVTDVLVLTNGQAFFVLEPRMYKKEKLKEFVGKANKLLVP